MAKYPTVVPTETLKSEALAEVASWGAPGEAQSFLEALNATTPIGRPELLEPAADPFAGLPSPFGATPPPAQPAGSGSDTSGLRGTIVSYANQRLGDEGARVIDAILETEGGLTGAIGDTDLPGGGSYGPFQFYRQYGQLPNLAKTYGWTEDYAAQWVQENPAQAAQWAIDNYLGAAIKEGQAKGLTGADLATYAQQYGQVSDAPERAGQNYIRLYGGGGGARYSDAGTSPAYNGTDRIPYGQPQTQEEQYLAAQATLNAGRPSPRPYNPDDDPNVRSEVPRRSIYELNRPDRNAMTPFVAPDANGNVSRYQASAASADAWRATIDSNRLRGRSDPAAALYGGLGDVEEMAGRGMQMEAAKGSIASRQTAANEREWLMGRTQNPEAAAAYLEQARKPGSGSAAAQLGNAMVSQGQNIGREYSPDRGAEDRGLFKGTGTLEDVKQPAFWRDQVLRQLPFTGAAIAASVPAGIAGAAVAGPAGGLAGSLAAPVAFEAWTEAGGAFTEAKRRGMTDEQAVEAANKAFAGNVAALVMDPVQLASMGVGRKYLPAGLRRIIDGQIAKTVPKKALYEAGRLVLNSGIEGSQEVAQNMIQDWSLGDEVKLDTAENRQSAMAAVAMSFITGGYSSGRAVLTRTSEAEKRTEAAYQAEVATQKGNATLAEFHRARAAGQLDDETYRVGTYVAELHPEMNINTVWTVTDELKLATRESLRSYSYTEEQIDEMLASDSPPIETGMTDTTPATETSPAVTSIKLYAGADATTVLEEAYHQNFDWMSESERAEVMGLHAQAKATLRPTEWYAKGATRWAMSQKPWRSPIERIWDRTKVAVGRLAGRVSEIEGSNVDPQLVALLERQAKNARSNRADTATSPTAGRLEAATAYQTDSQGAAAPTTSEPAYQIRADQLPEGYTVRHGEYGPAKRMVAVYDPSGKMAGPFRETEADALKGWQERNQEITIANDRGRRYDAALGRMRDGTVTDADRKTLVDGADTITAGRARGALREMGISAKDTERIVRSARPLRYTRGGATILDAAEIVAAGERIISRDRVAGSQQTLSQATRPTEPAGEQLPLDMRSYQIRAERPATDATDAADAKSRTYSGADVADDRAYPAEEPDTDEESDASAEPAETSAPPENHETAVEPDADPIPAPKTGLYKGAAGARRLREFGDTLTPIGDLEFTIEGHTVSYQIRDSGLWETPHTEAEFRAVNERVAREYEQFLMFIDPSIVYQGGLALRGTQGAVAKDDAERRKAGKAAYDAAFATAYDAATGRTIKDRIAEAKPIGEKARQEAEDAYVSPLRVKLPDSMTIWKEMYKALEDGRIDDLLGVSGKYPTVDSYLTDKLGFTKPTTVELAKALLQSYDARPEHVRDWVKWSKKLQAMRDVYKALPSEAAYEEWAKHPKTMAKDLILGGNGKAGMSVDFGLITCRPTRPCHECYAAALTRQSIIDKSFRNMILVLKDPEGFGRRVAQESNRKNREAYPFVRLLGQGDITSDEQVTAFNKLAEKSNRPIMIFSRHHELLAELKQSNPAAPFLKMGSVDVDVYHGTLKNEAFGPKYLYRNMDDRGINNVFLFTDRSEAAAIADLFDNNALGLVLSASGAQHAILEDALRKHYLAQPNTTEQYWLDEGMSAEEAEIAAREATINASAKAREIAQGSCPCDASERTYLSSCPTCAMSMLGCHMAFMNIGVMRHDRPDLGLKQGQIVNYKTLPDSLTMAETFPLLSHFMYNVDKIAAFRAFALAQLAKSVALTNSNVTKFLRKNADILGDEKHPRRMDQLTEEEKAALQGEIRMKDERWNSEVGYTKDWQVARSYIENIKAVQKGMRKKGNDIPFFTPGAMEEVSGRDAEGQTVKGLRVKNEHFIQQAHMAWKNPATGKLEMVERTGQAVTDLNFQQNWVYTPEYYEMVAKDSTAPLRIPWLPGTRVEYENVEMTAAERAGGAQEEEDEDAPKPKRPRSKKSYQIRNLPDADGTGSPEYRELLRTIKGPFNELDRIEGNTPESAGTVVVTESGAMELGPIDERTEANLSNLRFLGVDDATRATLIEVARLNPEMFEAARRGVITHKQLVADVARDGGLTIEEFLRTKPGRAFNEHELIALRAANVAATARLVRLAAEAGPEPRAADQVKLIHAMIEARSLQAVTRGASATAGRTLNAHKITIEQEWAMAVTAQADRARWQRELDTRQSSMDKIAADLEGRAAALGIELPSMARVRKHRGGGYTLSYKIDAQGRAIDPRTGQPFGEGQSFALSRAKRLERAKQREAAAEETLATVPAEYDQVQQQLQKIEQELEQATVNLEYLNDAQGGKTANGVFRTKMLAGLPDAQIEDIANRYMKHYDNVLDPMQGPYQNPDWTDGLDKEWRGEFKWGPQAGSGYKKSELRRDIRLMNAEREPIAARQQALEKLLNRALTTLEKNEVAKVQAEIDAAESRKAALEAQRAAKREELAQAKVARAAERQAAREERRTQRNSELMYQALQDAMDEYEAGLQKRALAWISKNEKADAKEAERQRRRDNAAAALELVKQARAGLREQLRREKDGEKMVAALLSAVDAVDRENQKRQAATDRREQRANEMDERRADRAARLAETARQRAEAKAQVDAARKELRDSLRSKRNSELMAAAITSALDETNKEAAARAERFARRNERADEREARLKQHEADRAQAGRDTQERRDLIDAIAHLERKVDRIRLAGTQDEGARIPELTEARAELAAKRQRLIDLTPELSDKQKELKAQRDYIRENRNRLQEGVKEEKKAWDALQRADEVQEKVDARKLATARKLLERMGGAEVTGQLIEQFQAVIRSGDPIAIAKFLQAMQRTSWWERATILRYGSMLSSVGTHATNLTSNAAMAALEVPVRGIAGGVDAMRAAITGGPRTVYASEMGPLITGWIQGFQTGAVLGLDILRTGIDPLDVGKVEMGQGQMTTSFGMEQTRLGKAIGAKASDSVNVAMEAPSRLLMAADKMFRTAAETGEVHALALNRALTEGVAKDERAARAQEIVNNIIEYPEILEEAQKRAARRVFQENRVEVEFLKGRYKSPAGAAIISLFVPFVRTPYNIAAQGVAMSPAGFIGVVNAARAGDNSLAAERAARALVGTALLGLGVALGAAGMLTGGYPDDADERTTLPAGWQPYSLRLWDPMINDYRYYSYAQIGAPGFVLALAAALGDVAKKEQAGKTTTPTTYSARAAVTVAGWIADQPFLQGIAKGAQALGDPERFASGVLEGMSTQFVPFGAMQRQLTRILGMPTRDPNGVLEAMMAISPVTANAVPVKVDRLGDPVYPGQRGAEAVLPIIKSSPERDDAIRKAARGAGVNIPDAPRTVRNIKLTDSERRAYNIAAGQHMREMAPEWLDADFQSETPDGQRIIMERFIARARSMAANDFVAGLSDDEFSTRRQAGTDTE